MKKSVLLFTVLFSLCLRLSAFDLVFRATPAVFLPVDSKLGADTGFASSLQTDVDLFGFLTAGGEAFFNAAPQNIINENLFLYGAGIGTGGYYFPLSRLYVGGGLGLGFYSATTTARQNNRSTSGLYSRFYGEAGFRFSPEFTLAATFGYSNFSLTGKNNSENAIFIGLTARYSASVGKGGSSSFSAELEDSEAAFPVLMKEYRSYPFTTVTLKNNEGAEVKDVHVSFRAGKYTSSTYESTVIPEIKKYQSVQVPLSADFSKEILRLVESGKIAGEIIIDYTLLGKNKRTVQNAIISMNSSNSFIWIDPAALSSFISPDTPEILEFAKYVAGVARNSFWSGLNRNLQIAAAMTEAMKLCGISYSGDRQTPYTEFHITDKIDDIQYPLQTLNMSGGDYDDIGILLASCLESVGVPVGYIPFDDDFIVLVGMGISQGAEENHFASKDGLLIDDTDVYFGLSMKALSKGFSEARTEADKLISEVNNETYEGSVEYVIVENAWEIYEPCAFSENGAHYEKPSTADITKNFQDVIKQYINSDIQVVLKKALASGDHNRIGLAYTRLGRYSEARQEFQKSDSTSALNNLANIYMIEKNYTAAAKTYSRVLERDPDNAGAKKGLENANEKLEK